MILLDSEMNLLTDVTSGGYAFRIVFNWWEIASVVLLFVLVIYG